MFFILYFILRELLYFVILKRYKYIFSTKEGRFSYNLLLVFSFMLLPFAYFALYFYESYAYIFSLIALLLLVAFVKIDTLFRMNVEVPLHRLQAYVLMFLLILLFVFDMMVFYSIYDVFFEITYFIIYWFVGVAILVIYVVKELDDLFLIKSLVLGVIALIIDFSYSALVYSSLWILLEVISYKIKQRKGWLLNKS